MTRLTAVIAIYHPLSVPCLYLSINLGTVSYRFQFQVRLFAGVKQVFGYWVNGVNKPQHSTPPTPHSRIWKSPNSITRLTALREGQKAISPSPVGALCLQTGEKTILPSPIGVACLWQKNVIFLINDRGMWGIPVRLTNLVGSNPARRKAVNERLFKAILTVQVIQNGKVEFPNLSDAAPTLEKSHPTVDVKRQLVKKKPLAHCRSCVRGVIYPTRYSRLKFVNTPFLRQKYRS